MDDPRPPLVLAINDDPMILAVYRELLADEGYRVATQVHDGLGVEDVKALAPDLVVLDLLIGGRLWGPGFLAALRAEPGTRGLPVVVCSAAAEAVERLGPQLAAWGAAVVPKPFDVDDFLEVVRGMLEAEAVGTG